MGLFGQALDPATLTKPLGDDCPTYSGDYTGQRFSHLINLLSTDPGGGTCVAQDGRQSVAGLLGFFGLGSHF